MHIQTYNNNDNNWLFQVPGSTQYSIALIIYGGNADKVFISAKHTDTALKLTLITYTYTLYL